MSAGQDQALPNAHVLDGGVGRDAKGQRFGAWVRRFLAAMSATAYRSARCMTRCGRWSPIEQVVKPA